MDENEVFEILEYFSKTIKPKLETVHLNKLEIDDFFTTTYNCVGKWRVIGYDRDKRNVKWVYLEKGEQPSVGSSSGDLLVRKIEKPLPDKKEENFIETYDKDGNLIGYQHRSDGKIPDKKEDAEFELRDGLIQKKEHRNPDEEQPEPHWVEVQGAGASFYYICPICGAQVPGTGPKFEGPDNVLRVPKEQHEYYHKSVACDWYSDDV